MSLNHNLYCYVIFIVFSWCHIFTYSTAYLSFTHSRIISNVCQSWKNGRIEKTFNQYKTSYGSMQPLKDKKLDPFSNHNNFETSSYFTEIGDTLNSNDVVIKQYESLPYPEFSESNILSEEEYYKTDVQNPKIFIPSHSLEKINHYFYAGDQNFRGYFRFIEAGGGTGNVAVFMGEQLNHTNAEIVYLDFSLESVKIAQKRARARSIKNIVFIKDSIENIRYLGLGLFDVLNSSGVLHHLISPILGLKILKDILVKEGKLVMMLYATYGRTAVYQMQNIFQLVNDETFADIKFELKNANCILSKLPKSNWFEKTSLDLGIGDHKLGDIGIYDLLLHKRDVSFNFPTLFEWLRNAGLHFTELAFPSERYLLKVNYVFSDIILKTKLFRLGLSSQFHITELLHGKVIKHSFYATKRSEPLNNLCDSSNILYVYGNPHGLREAIDSSRNYKQFGNDTYFRAHLSEKFVIQDKTTSRTLPYNELPSANQKLVISFKSSNFTNILLARLVNSNKGVKLSRLFLEYSLSSNSTKSQPQLLLKELYEAVKDADLFLIKKEHILPFPKTAFTQLYKITSNMYP